LLLALALIPLALACSSCASYQRFTPQRYSLIYTGQKQSEVLELLGEPTHRFADHWQYHCQIPFYKATVEFRDGRVSGKRWWDSEPGSGAR
jgi:hypothetical protein